jgi:Fic family protein
VNVLTSTARKEHIKTLKYAYEKLYPGHEELLRIVTESELPEMVYNSNAIENSTLTLKETEEILLEQILMREVSLRETYEATNLARVIKYLWTKPHLKISIETLELLHQMLLGGIDDDFAGRIRQPGEYVRVGWHIAPAPEEIPEKLTDIINEYYSDAETYFIEKIARFHLAFETIHPFCDGNGRMGRVIINMQLADAGYPPVIIQNKGKRDNYYPIFDEYRSGGKINMFSDYLYRALSESLHKRLAYLRGDEIVRLSDYSKKAGRSLQSLSNAASRQSIPAFRQRGTWMIGAGYGKDSDALSSES